MDDPRAQPGTSGQSTRPLQHRPEALIDALASAHTRLMQAPGTAGEIGSLQTSSALSIRLQGSNALKLSAIAADTYPMSQEDTSTDRALPQLVCPRGHGLYGTVKDGVFIARACYKCEREWEAAWTKATGRTRNMAPEGFVYVCSHGRLCQIDRTGPMSSGYPYHVDRDGKGSQTCSDPTSVKKIPESDYQGAS